MLLWTIQTSGAWVELQSSGTLRGCRSRVEKDLIAPYDWMAAQMMKQIGPAPRPGALPIWAWFQWEGERKRPDLRATGHLPRGQRGVRIEFEVLDSRVLLSDFELWHYVLNYWYLPKSEQDDKAFESELRDSGLSFFETKPLPLRHWHLRIARSWERIFDLGWYDEHIAAPLQRKSMQATVWELLLDDVRGFRAFKAG